MTEQYNFKPCPTCDGTGEVQIKSVNTTVVCGTCDGEGWIDNQPEGATNVYKTV